MRVGIVAAEHSGDLLAAGLMREMSARDPDVRFEGVGGELMTAAGLESWYPMDRLSVMGLVEVVRHLPSLLALRRSLVRRWRESPPDVFIGVDAPDFNLRLETLLRRTGVRTVHYVCPTVWAWREGRVRSLRRAVDLILSILPFEVPFLERHQLPVTYVGHPLAADFPLEPPRAEARVELGIDADAQVLALLPGSRTAEIAALSVEFIAAAERCRERIGDIRVVVPLVSEASRAQFDALHSRHAPNASLSIVVGRTRTALAAADVVLTASGTATFETLLSKRPMVVGYRVHPLTYWLVRALDLINVEHVAMANLLAGERLAPEFLQGDCRADTLGDALIEFFQRPDKVAAIAQRYRELHQSLRIDTNALAAEAVLRLARS